MADEKRDVQLNPSRFQLLEHLNVAYGVTVEQGTKLADVMKPAFWAHVAAKLRPYDEVTVRIDDGTWLAKIVVLSTGRAWAKVHLLHEYKLSAADTDLSQAAHNEGYKVMFRGPHLQWCIVRVSDGEPIKEQMQREEEAQAALRDFLKNTELA